VDNWENGNQEVLGRARMCWGEPGGAGENHHLDE